MPDDPNGAPAPYRALFPLGLACGVAGVGEWLFWSVGWARSTGVTPAHVILQTQGFLSAFVAGFLLTAFPRFTGARPASRLEITAALAAGSVVLAGALAERWVLAQTAYAALWGGLVLFVARRVKARTKPLPPSFLLLGFALAQAATGTALFTAGDFGRGEVTLALVGRQLLGTGFTLCAVLGVTGALAPFLLGHTAPPPRAGARTAHGVAGLLLFGSLLVPPASEGFSAAAGVRAVVATAHLLAFARIGRWPAKRTTGAVLFYLSCWAVAAGLWAAFLWPAHRVAALHVTFIAGFSLMIFSFGTMVVLTHESRAALLNGPLPALRGAGGMVLAAAGLRLAADALPGHYNRLIHSAAGLWVLASLGWGVTVWAAVRRPARRLPPGG